MGIRSLYLLPTAFACAVALTPLRSGFSRPRVSSLSVSEEAPVHDRRDVLQRASAMLAAVFVATAAPGAPVPLSWAEDTLSGTVIFDETGRIVSGASEADAQAGKTAQVTLREAGTVYRIPSAWERSSKGFVDKFSKESVVSDVAVAVNPSRMQSIKDLGKIEYVKVGAFVRARREGTGISRGLKPVVPATRRCSQE